MRTKGLTGKGLHTELGMIGYCLKDAGRPGFDARMSESITQEVKDAARNQYLLYGNVTSKGRAALSPRNILEKAYTFMITNNLPKTMTLQSVIACMHSHGLFFPSYNFVNTNTGALNLQRANAAFRLTHAEADTLLLDDLAEVYFGGIRVGMWTMEDALATVTRSTLQLEAQAAREAAGDATVTGIVNGVLAAAQDGAGPSNSAPSPADAARAANIKRVRNDMAAMLESERLIKPRVYETGERPRLIFHIGPTGTGKTRACMQRYPTGFWWYPVNGGNSVWIDGYKGEDLIVLDEFYGGLDFVSLRVLCGFAQCSFQVKGGIAQVLAKTFVFTSTTEPSTWYEDPRGEWARRIAEFGTFVRY